VSVSHFGSNRKYSEGWDKAFGGKRKIRKRDGSAKASAKKRKRKVGT
jgi:hypothetical protein